MFLIKKNINTLINTLGSFAAKRVLIEFPKLCEAQKCVGKTKAILSHLPNQYR